MRKIFIDLYEVLKRCRRTGTTNALKELSKSDDVWVLVPNKEMKKEFGKSALTFDELDKIQGTKPKPILFDNYTMIQLTEGVLNEFRIMDRKISEMDRLIETIRTEIEYFDRENIKNKKRF